MHSILFKSVLPCGIVIALTVVPLLFFVLQTDDNSIGSILHALETAPSLDDSLTVLEHHIRVVEDVMPDDEVMSYNQIYHLRYQAALRLSKRGNTDGLTAALHQFELIYQQHPSYNLGWVPFLMGDLYLQLEQWNQAARVFNEVPFYNHGSLALRARFQLARLLSGQGQPVSSSDVYYFLRFVSSSPANDAAAIHTDNWLDDEYVAYIQSLQELEAGNTAKAHEFMTVHSRAHPHDPSANYYLSVPFPSFSEYGVDVVDHAYANGGLISGSVMLKRGHSLLSDFYIDEEKMTEEIVFTIEAETAHTEFPLIEVILNQDHQTKKTLAFTELTQPISIPVKQGKNVVEIRWQTNQPANQEVDHDRNVWIRSAVIHPQSRKPSP